MSRTDFLLVSDGVHRVECEVMHTLCQLLLHGASYSVILTNKCEELVCEQ